MMTGDEFRRWRERHRMTQEQAGELHRVDGRTVRRWEAAAVDERARAMCLSWDVMTPECRLALWRALGCKDAKPRR